MKTLNFIAALNLSTDMINYLQAGNCSDISISNISAVTEGKGKEKKITGYKWTETTDFYLIENLELPTEALFANEIFRYFNNNKNAVASFLWVAENNGNFDADLFKTQHQKTPKFEDWKNLKSFKQLWDALTDEQKQIIIEKSNDWAISEGYGKHEFDTYYIAKNDEKLKAGDFIKINDPLTNKPLYAFVTQVSPTGFVTAYNGNNIFTLTADAHKFLSIISKEQLTANAKISLTGEAIDLYHADLHNRRTKGLEKGEKLHLQAIADAGKAEKKAKAEAEKNKATAQSTTLTGRLEKINLTDSEKIKKFADSLNAKRSILTKDDYKKLAEKLKTAKAIEKTKLETKKAEEKAKAEAEKAKTATATAEQPTQEATPAPNKPKRAQRTTKAKTLDTIIAEDAQSAEPIL